MMVSIRTLQEADMRELSRRLRHMDRLELASLAQGQTTDEVLMTSVRDGYRARAGFCDGDLVACWGIMADPAIPTEGAPWLLATDALNRPEVRRAFIRHGSEELKSLAQDFRRLWNFVHRENRTAQRWLRFMGFEFRDAEEYVFSGEPFVRFEMEVV